VGVLSSAVLSTAKARLDVAQRAQASVVVEQGGAGATGAALLSAAQIRSAAQFVTPQPIPADVVKAALAQVDKELMAEGLLDKNGNVNPNLVKQLSWERQVALPTPGVLVKGCLDDCDICEPDLQEKINLELTRMKLENDLLQKKIDLLEKSQKYRCCPDGEEGAPSPAPDT
jgi:hypothetical protein